MDMYVLVATYSMCGDDESCAILSVWPTEDLALEERERVYRKFVESDEISDYAYLCFQVQSVPFREGRDF